MEKPKYKCVRACFDNKAGQYYYAERFYEIDKTHELAMHFVDAEGKPLAPVPACLTEVRSGRMSKPTTDERMEQLLPMVEELVTKPKLVTRQ